MIERAAYRVGVLWVLCVWRLFLCVE